MYIVYYCKRKDLFYLDKKGKIKKTNKKRGGMLWVGLLLYIQILSSEPQDLFAVQTSASSLVV